LSVSEQRKLATIMAIDVAGYSRAAEKDDSAAAAGVERTRAAINAIIEPMGGRVFNTAGDGFMIELPTASAGVDAAVQLLQQTDVPSLRIGVHVGEVIVTETGDLLGHGVNVAARLQQLAEPGSAIISQAALVQKAGVTARALGRVRLDKMREQQEVFALGAKPGQRFPRVFWRRWRAAGIGVVAALAVTIVAASFWPGAPWRNAEPPRLAVLRFENSDETEPAFAEEVADELITELSRVRGMEVTARASSFSLSGNRATPANAARELGARFVLMGSVRRLPQAIRVHADLVEAPSGRVIWTHAFEGPSTDAFLLQREMAVQVAQAVGARLSAPPPHRVDPEAYQNYVQARELQTRSVQGNWRDVRDLYRGAVDRDPSFVQAWAALARAEANVANEAMDGGPPDATYTPAMVAPALAAAQRAISLDDGLAEPYMVRSLIYSWLGDWRQAASAVREGEARGGHAGAFYRAVGYLRESLRARREAVSLDPLSADEWTNLAFTCEYVDDEACQLEAAQRAHDLSPNDGSAARGLVRALVANSRRPDAWSVIQQMHWETKTDLTGRVLRWRAGHGQPPRPAEVQAALDGHEYIDTAVGVLADVGEWDAAARLLDRWGPPSRSYIFGLFRTQWAPLRRKPQFWALMQREGLLAFWRASSRWPDFCESEPVCAPYRT
jgi:adenylate cyclase